MIALTNFSDRVTPPVACTDPKVSAVLDHAEFYRWKQNIDGSRTAFFRLRKTIGGIAAGSVLSLENLHEKLFP